MKRTRSAMVTMARLSPLLAVSTDHRGADDGVLRYIELKTGHSDNGLAWIAHVKLSKSGQE